MSVCAVVDGVIRLPGSEIHPKALERLWSTLTFRNPDFIKALRFGRPHAGMPETITLLEPGPGGALLVPRGAVGLVRDALDTAGQEIRFEDRRAVLPPVGFALRIEPRDYQARAAAELARRVQGVVVGPCGSGKTTLCTAALARVRQPALVLVRSRDLVDQWCGAIESTLGVVPGVVAEGRFAPDVVTVATIQTLAAMDEAALGALGRCFGCVIFDEAHSVAAPTDRRILARLPARYRFGCTATPEREDGLGALLHLCIGPEVHRIEHRELIEAGHLLVPRVETIHTGCAPEAETHVELVSALVADEARNALIVELVAREARAGRSVLVLSGRVEHCERLALMLRAEGVMAEALTSEVPRARRADRLGRFRGGALEVVCATSLADEGLDVPRLERLVLATPARAEGRTVQRLGRLMRPYPGKAESVLYDLVDEGRIAQAQFRARCAAYRKVLGIAPTASVTRARRPIAPSGTGRLELGHAARRNPM